MRALLLSISLLTLSGCATLQGNNVESEWECPAQKGFACRSIKSIRTMIAEPGSAPTPVVLGATPQIKNAGVPEWRPDQIMKIYVGDFVDQQGNYHEEHVIYSVVEQGGWAIEGD